MDRVGEQPDGAGDTTIATCTSVVTIKATNDTLTAWMPRRSATSVSLIESAASWLCGRKISAKAPRRPRTVVVGVVVVVAMIVVVMVVMVVRHVLRLLV